MSGEKDDLPASSYQVDPETALTLRIMDQFFRARAEAMETELFERRVKPTYHRDCLLRYLIMEYAEGRTPTLKELQVELEYVGSQSTTALEIKQLRALGIIERGKWGEGAAVYRFRPTQRTVEFYNRAVPVLVHGTRTIFNTLM